MLFGKKISSKMSHKISSFHWNILISNITCEVLLQYSECDEKYNTFIYAGHMIFRSCFIYTMNVVYNECYRNYNYKTFRA